MKQAFYTIDEAARLLRVSRQTIYRLLQARKLKGVKVSDRRTVIPAQAIERLTDTDITGGEDNAGEDAAQAD